jgi:hypothetical protein
LVITIKKGEPMLFKFNQDKEVKPARKPLKIYSPDEVVKAGGADKFAKKIGHKSVSEEIAGSIPFTDEEWAEVEKMLEKD